MTECPLCIPYQSLCQCVLHVFGMRESGHWVEKSEIKESAAAHKEPVDSCHLRLCLPTHNMDNHVEQVSGQATIHHVPLSDEGHAYPFDNFFLLIISLMFWPFFHTKDGLLKCWRGPQFFTNATRWVGYIGSHISHKNSILNLDKIHALHICSLLIIDV